MGRGDASATQMVELFCSVNKKINRRAVEKFAAIYIQECAAEGVNHDVAFVQMCLETNWLRFGGQVDKRQNNFCGLGAVDGGAVGASFKTPRLGVRAQVQHLKAYGSKEPLNRVNIDPRFSLVKRGCAPTISGLTKRWASDPKYHIKLDQLLNRLYQQ